MSLYNLMNNVDVLVEDYIKEAEAVQVTPAELGLDERAAYHPIYLTSEALIFSNMDRGRVEYYGGFEYVDKRAVMPLGNYIFYRADDARVAGHIDNYLYPDSTDEHEEE